MKRTMSSMAEETESARIEQSGMTLEVLMCLGFRQLDHDRPLGSLRRRYRDNRRLAGY